MKRTILAIAATIAPSVLSAHEFGSHVHLHPHMGVVAFVVLVAAGVLIAWPKRRT